MRDLRAAGSKGSGCRAGAVCAPLDRLTIGGVQSTPQRPNGHIVVTGLPGSGKTTLAQHLATAFDMPLIAKDELRYVLFDALQVDRHDPAQRKIVGLAAISLQYHLMATLPPLVVDS